VRYLIFVALAAAAGALLWFRPQAPAAATAAAAWATTQPYPRAAAPHSSSTPSQTLVYVAGEVQHPGVYTLAPNARVRDAVALAGGLRPNADPIAVNLAAHVLDGDEIVVTAVGATPPHHARGGHAGPAHRGRHHHRGHRSQTAQAAPSGPIDLNRADAAALGAIPGIGPGLAARIVAFRENNGPFASPDELLDVSGITDRRLDALLPYVVVR
jgi:competence protein ComEA